MPASASTISNSAASFTRSRLKQKIHSHSQIKDQHQNQGTYNRWKSDAEQRIYSSKIFGALRQIRLSHSSTEEARSVPRHARALRDAASRLLAMAAKGRTRWSRSILAPRRLKLKFTKRKRRSAAKKPPSIMSLKGKKQSTLLHRNARFLGRLVPGCRKEPFPVILEEAIDYIPALEMQIRAMSSVLELLSGAVSSSPTTVTTTTQPE